MGTTAVRTCTLLTIWSRGRTAPPHQRWDCAVALQRDWIDLRLVRFGQRCRCRLAVLGLLLPLLAGCGGQVAGEAASATAAPTATPNPLVQAAATGTAIAAATANQQDVLAFQTAQASAQAKAATPTPAPVLTSTPVPVSVPTSVASSKSSATPTPYVADFSTWPTATPVPTTPVRVSYDAKNQQYVIAITNPKWSDVYIQYLPEAMPFSDFTLDVDARQIEGPATASFGVVFGAQPKGPQDKVNARYNFLVILGEQVVGVTHTNSDDQKTLLGRTAASVLKNGGATNHLQITRTNDQIGIAINGQHIVNYSAANTVPGAIGLLVLNPVENPGSSGAAVAFSQLRVTPLTP